jgi:hypothetical protein
VVLLLLELTLYLLIGFAGLMIKKADSVKAVGMDLLTVLLWPFVLLLKYVDYIDAAKQKYKKK